MVKKWETKSEKSVLSAKVFKYREVERTSPDSGKTGKFDVLDCWDWVNIVALTAENEVVMVEQYRQGIDSITLEIPGGVGHPGEDIIDGAKRELAEETGYQSTEWVKLGQVDANPAFMSNTCATYLALNCQKAGPQNLDPLEEIDIKLVPLKDIPTLIKEGKITHSLVVAAFHLFDLSTSS
ncbi:MAG: NUDIX hydrolase [Epsilonproteobacteria bacterium]|nr:MAG: NUDIX hydrolase [Campylobacterota bacterium]RLA66757.1 MAG: NUDIX hydrolase [Campylobacterota bacterium]